MGRDPAVIHLKDRDTRDECQDFIDDRVLKAQLRAWGEEMQRQEEPDWETLTALLALAEDDHG